MLSWALGPSRSSFDLRSCADELSLYIYAIYIIYIHIYIYICVYVCMCICVYVCVCACSVCNHENNVPFRLSPQWLFLWQLMHLGTSVHYVPKCMSCHKATVVITGMVHYRRVHWQFYPLFIVTRGYVPRAFRIP